MSIYPQPKKPLLVRMSFRAVWSFKKFRITFLFGPQGYAAQLSDGQLLNPWMSLGRLLPTNGRGNALSVVLWPFCVSIRMAPYEEKTTQPHFPSKSREQFDEEEARHPADKWRVKNGAGWGWGRGTTAIKTAPAFPPIPRECPATKLKEAEERMIKGRETNEGQPLA